MTYAAIFISLLPTINRQDPEVKQVGNVSAVAKKHGISLATIHSWIRKQARQPKDDLIKKNKKLEKALADKELENQILKELLKKANHAWLGD